jgi:hypothetical protein
MGHPRWICGWATRLSDRLAAMPVRIEYLNAVAPEAWKEDWPAVAQGAGAEGGKGKI